MNHVLWTLLAVFIPNAIGMILYFILRDPVPVPCPSCGALARKGHAYCAGCGTAVRVACPQCRQPVEPGWRELRPLRDGARGAPRGRALVVGLRTAHLGAGRAAKPVTTRGGSFTDWRGRRAALHVKGARHGRSSLR